MKINSNSPFKKCPRCKQKCFKHDKVCPECGLVFERLNYTSNKTAKKLLWQRKYRETIMMSDWPHDVSKTKALLFAGFLGFVGAHNFYLGRLAKAFLVLIGFCLAMTMAILGEFGLTGSTAYEIVRYCALIPGSCCLIFWVSDFLAIFFERYKIPVAIDEKLYQLKDSVIQSDENFNKKAKKSKKLKE